MHGIPLARRILAILSVALLLLTLVPPSLASAPIHADADDPSNPSEATKLIFIHHSCGSNWLSDSNGGLGIALRDANYFVSDTNYGWGENDIGSYTDIGHWWTWFQGPDSSTYTTDLYAESAQHTGYSRLGSDPGGENEIIMFKSCYPNSNVRDANGPIPTSGNPLRGDSSGSSDHTLNNCQGIYVDLLDYFSAHTEKLFVVVTAPPLASSAYGDNARMLNNWLVNDWLADYPHNNVAVFDFYNVLTSSGGDANTHDLGWDMGNHHRWRDGAIEHTKTVDENLSAYAIGGDSHPTAAGNQKATGEFVTLLNVAYHRWKDGSTPTRDTWSVALPWISCYGRGAGGWTDFDTLPRSVGDVDGDGRADIVGFGNRVTYVSRSTGAGFGPPEAWITCYGPLAGGWSSFDTFPRAVGDVNGDGRADVVGFGNRATYVSLATGTAFEAPKPWVYSYGPAAGGWSSFDTFPRRLGDVNGDGKDDIVGFGNKATYVSLSSGSSFGPPTEWAHSFGPAAGGWMTFDLYPRCVGDVNGDGKDDIVGFGNLATYVALSTGSGFGPGSAWSSSFGANAGAWTSFNTFPRCVADVDGDGKSDIVGFKDSATWIAYSTGASFLSPQAGIMGYGTSAGGWSSFGAFPRMAADVDNDGQGDIVGFGNKATYVSLAH